MLKSIPVNRCNIKKAHVRNAMTENGCRKGRFHLYDILFYFHFFVYIFVVKIKTILESDFYLFFPYLMQKIWFK